MVNMTSSKKEIAYWLSLVLYGILLVGLLLYLRFPGGKFRQFSCDLIEKRIPGVTCSIGSTGYGFPLKILYGDVQLSDAVNSEVKFFEDSLLVIEPVWRNPTRAISLQSNAFGGSHSGLLVIEDENDTIELRDLRISNLDLGKLQFLQGKLDRNLTGLLEAQVSSVLEAQGFTIVTAQGSIGVSEGTLELKKPILELTTFEIQESSFDFDMKGKELKISNGEVTNPKLKVNFAGEMTLAEPILAGTISLQGGITPQAHLFQGKRELKTIVTRMQRRYGDVSLPFRIDGTIGRPTFVFER